MPNPSPIPTRPPAVLRASDRFLSQLDKRGDSASASMLGYFDAIQKVLNGALDSLLQQMKDQESPTNTQLYQLDRYHALLRQVQDEMGRVGQQMAAQLPSVLKHAEQVGIDAAEELVRMQANTPEIRSAFNRLSVPGIQRAVSFVQPASPLMNMLTNVYGQSWAVLIASQYVTGVALGQSPRVVVDTLKQTVSTAMPADLDRIIRTAQIYSYRETNHVAWRQSGVVDTWTWSATLDPTTCSSCWSQHGSIHPVTETLRDHHRGRCASLPNVTGEQPLDVPSGENVFNRRSASEQEKIAREGGWGAQYRAYKDGAISFAQMSGTHHDDIYGPMKAANSLKAILGDNASQYYK